MLSAYYQCNTTYDRKHHSIPKISFLSTHSWETILMYKKITQSSKEKLDFVISPI